MIMTTGRVKYVSESKPCGCDGNCPFGYPERSCPASTASASIRVVPVTYEELPFLITSILPHSEAEPEPEAMRPEDV